MSIRIVRRITLGTLVLSLGASRLASADPVAPISPDPAPEKSLTEAIGLAPAGSDGGFGPSVLANVTRLFASGRYDVLAAGIGLGISWKNKSASRFPLEIGAYVAPQFTGDDKNATGVVAGIIHFTLLKGFGLGAGFEGWRKGIGFGGGDASERFFVTLGYGITNDTKTAAK